MLKRIVNQLGQSLSSPRRSRRQQGSTGISSQIASGAAALAVESLEARQLLTAGELSILGGEFGVDFDPDSDAFVRYDRETDTLHLRVRGNISQDKLNLEVDTKGFLEREILTNQTIFVDTTVRLNDAIDFRRGEGLGGDPDFADFLVKDFLFRVSLRATNQTAPNAVITTTKAESIAEAERDTSTIRLVRSIQNSQAQEVGEVEFARVNAPAIEVRGPENNEALIDQDIPFTVDLVNLPPANHRVTVRITGEGDPIVRQFEFTTDKSRNRQVQFNQLFTTAGQKQVSVQVESIGGSTTSFAPTVLEIREPDPATGRLPGDPLVGANNLLRLNPFDVTQIGGFSSSNQESFIRIGAISGSVSSVLFGAPTVRITGVFLAETDLFNFGGEQPAGDFHPEPIERSVVVSLVPGDSIDAEFGRHFSTLVNFDDSGLRLIDRSLKVELLDPSGAVLDTVQFSKSQLQGLRSDRGNELPDDFGQIRPLNLDVRFNSNLNLIGGSVFTLSNGTIRVTGEVTIDNLLPQLGDVPGDATIRIDFGDGSDPLVVELNDGDRGATARALGRHDSTSLLSFGQSFAHDYTQFGEFDITATVTLPNGRAAAERQTVTIVSQPNVRIAITSAIEQPNGLVRVIGRVLNQSNSQSFPVTVRIGDLSRDSFTLNTDSNGNFDELLLLPENVDDLIPAGEQSARLAAFLEIESSDHRLTHVPFELEVVRPGSSFVTNTSSTLTFRGFGDFFEIDVPLRITTDQANNAAAVGTVTKVSNVNGRTHVVLNLKNDAVANAAPGGLFNGRGIQSSRIDSTEDIVIRSFFNPPGGGDPVLLDTSSFSAGLLVDAVGFPRPQVLVVNESSVLEATNFRPTFQITSIPGPATIEVEYADGVTIPHAINFPGGTGTIVNFPTRKFAQAPGDGPSGDIGFQVRVIQNGNAVAQTAGNVTVRDHGLNGLTPLATELKGRSNLATGQLDVELTVRVQDTNPDDELTATVDWGDGIVDEVVIARNPAENFEGVFILNHSYFQEFLQAKFGEGQITRPDPVINVRDNSGTVLRVFVFNFNVDNAAQFRRIGFEVAEDPTLLQARVEAENGAVMGDRRVTANEAFVVDIITGRTDTSIRSEFLNLAEGEEKVVFIDLNQDEQAGGERNGPFIKLVMVGGDGSQANDLFQIEDPDGTRHGRVAYFRVPDARRFASIDRIRLVDLDTNEPLIKYDKTGRFTLEAFIENSDGEREAIGAVDIAVFPKLEDVAVREDGSLTGLISGLSVNEFHLVDPATGFRQNEIGEIDGSGPGDTFVASLDGDLPGLLQEGGSFLIEVSDGVLGRTLLPVTIGDPQFDGILLEAPEFVNQGQPFQLIANLPQPLLDLLAERGDQGINLKLDLADGRVFDVAISPNIAFIDLGLDANQNPQLIPLPFNAENGRLIFVNDETTALFLALDQAGPQDVQLFGEGSFGNVIVNVSDVRPSVTPALEVNPQGRIIGALLLESPKGIQIRALGKVINVPPGAQVIAGEDLDPNDGQVFEPGQAIQIRIQEAGGDSEPVFTMDATLNAQGNQAPQLSDVNVEKQSDGSFKVTGNVNDAEGNSTKVVIRDTRGTELGRQEFVEGDGRFTFTMNFVPDQLIAIIQATDDQGGFASQAIRFALAFELNLPTIDSLIANLGIPQRFLQIGAEVIALLDSQNVEVTFESDDGDFTIEGSDNPAARSSSISGTLDSVNRDLDAIRFDPAPGFLGNAQIRVGIRDTDDSEKTARTTLDIPVNVPNRAPVITDAFASFVFDPLTELPVAIRVAATVTDPDADAVEVFITVGDTVNEAEPGLLTDPDGFESIFNSPGPVESGQPFPVAFITAVDAKGATSTVQLPLFLLAEQFFRQDQTVLTNATSGQVTLTANDDGSHTISGRDTGSDFVAFFERQVDGRQILFAQGIGGTTVNGTRDPVPVGRTIDITRIETTLGNGSDVTIVDGVRLPFDSDLGSTPGDDLMVIQDAAFADSLSIDVGPDEDVGPDDDQVFLTSVDVAGNAVVQMGHGNDRFESAAFAVEGNLEIRAGAGDDHIDASGTAVGGTSIIDAATGNDNVIGTPGDDTIRVADGGDTIDGGGGNDRVIVETGNRPVRREGSQIFIGDDDPVTLINIESVQFVNSSATPLVIDLSDNDDSVFLVNHHDGSFTMHDVNNSSGGSLRFVPPAEGVVVNGRNGNDRIDFTAATIAVTLNGDDGNDVLIGGSNNDLLNGGSGNDLLQGRRGADLQDGGAGDDLFVWNNGDGADDNIGGADRDFFAFLGANGADDHVGLFRAASRGESGDSTLPGATVDVTRFAPSAFTIELAEIEVVTVDGLIGNDTIDATALPAGLLDQLIIRGGEGDDHLFGSGGADLIFGGAGNDLLQGRGGNDTQVGDDGDDLFVWNNGDGADDNVGGAGRDFFTFLGANGADDVIRLLTSGAVGETGDGTLPGATVELTRTAPTPFTIELATMEVITVRGLAGNDAIDATALPAGRIEELILRGGAGNDSLSGSAGDDVLAGEAGDDVLTGRRGNDRHLGGDGSDLFVWNNGDGADDNDGGDGVDFFTFNGADGADDEIELRAAADNGAAGDGTLPGAVFDLTRIAPSAFTIENTRIDFVTINGLGGNDTIRTNTIPEGLLRSIIVNGGTGNDRLIGGDADERLSGGDGNDVLRDGAGNDFLDGGPGDDRFELIPGGLDVIRDDDGNDTLDFTNAVRQVTINVNQRLIQVVDSAGSRIGLLGGPFESVIGSGTDAGSGTNAGSSAGEGSAFDGSPTFGSSRDSKSDGGGSTGTIVPGSTSATGASASQPEQSPALSGAIDDLFSDELPELLSSL